MSSEEIETDWFNETVEGTDSAINNAHVTEYLIPIIFALIFIISVLGNGTMVTIFMKERNMRNISNMYIMSLTLSGLFATVFVVPFVLLQHALKVWYWGSLICKFSSIIYVMTEGMPGFTLVAFSSERYLVLKNRFRKSQIKCWTISSLILIWVLGCIIAVPTAIFSHVYEYESWDGSTESLCFLSPIDADTYKIYDAVIKAIIQYIFPFLIITYLYILMARNLHTVQYTSSQRLQAEFNNEESPNEVKTKRQLDWMVLSLAIVFFICYLPHYIHLLYFYLSPDMKYNHNEYWQAFGYLAFCLRYFYSCMNPIVLYFVSDTYKLCLQKYFICNFGLDVSGGDSEPAAVR